MVTYARQVTIDSKSLKISATENNCAEVFVDRLVECLGRSKVRLNLLGGMWVFSIPIDSRLKACMCQWAQGAWRI